LEIVARGAGGGQISPQFFLPKSGFFGYWFEGVNKKNWMGLGKWDISMLRTGSNQSSPSF
jgi:hypothetical protein